MKYMLLYYALYYKLVFSITIGREHTGRMEYFDHQFHTVHFVRTGWFVQKMNTGHL